jgi:hypothetical protein
VLDVRYKGENTKEIKLHGKNFVVWNISVIYLYICHIFIDYCLSTILEFLEKKKSELISNRFSVRRVLICEAALNSRQLGRLGVAVYLMRGY